MNTQISKITTLFLNYPKMLQVWNATEFVFLSDDCVSFKVSTPIYKCTGMHLPAKSCQMLEGEPLTS